MSRRRDQATGLKLLKRSDERHAGFFIVPELTDPVTGFPTFIYETWGDHAVPSAFFPLTDHPPAREEVAIPSDEDLQAEMVAVSTLVGLTRRLIHLLSLANQEIAKRDQLLAQLGTITETMEAVLATEHGA